MFKRIILTLAAVFLAAQAPPVVVTTRSGAGVPLTWTQMDKNYTDLQHAANASQQAWGQKETATSGLVYGYFGGPVLSGSSAGDGTIALAASNTNYIERTPTGTVSANTAGWTAGNGGSARRRR